MNIKTTVFPLRASLKKKEPWELLVEIENEDPVPKKVSVEITLPQQVTLSTVGITRGAQKRIDSFKANDKTSIKLPVYLSNYASEGNYFGKVKVMEHFNDYAYVQRTFSKDIPFRIVA